MTQKYKGRTPASVSPTCPRDGEERVWALLLPSLGGSHMVLKNSSVVASGSGHVATEGG